LGVFVCPTPRLFGGEPFPGFSEGKTGGEKKKKISFYFEPFPPPFFFGGGRNSFFVLTISFPQKKKVFPFFPPFSGKRGGGRGPNPLRGKSGALGLGPPQKNPLEKPFLCFRGFSGGGGKTGAFFLGEKKPPPGGDFLVNFFFPAGFFKKKNFLRGGGPLFTKKKHFFPFAVLIKKTPSKNPFVRGEWGGGGWGENFFHCLLASPPPKTWGF